MTVRKAIRTSLRLLTQRDRRRLALITVAQMLTSILDLVGVLLLGLVTALSLSVMSSVPQPVIVGSTLEFLGLSNDDPVTVALALAAVVAGSPECLAEVLKVGVDPNGTNIIGRTPVLEAVKLGKYRCLYLNETLFITIIPY